MRRAAIIVAALAAAVALLRGRRFASPDARHDAVALVISHPDDEARFATDDLVRFGDNVSALAQGYARLARMEPAARVQLARARAAAYKRAFAPAAVFAAAGIGAS